MILPSPTGRICHRPTNSRRRHHCTDLSYFFKISIVFRAPPSQFRRLFTSLHLLRAILRPQASPSKIPSRTLRGNWRCENTPSRKSYSGSCLSVLSLLSYVSSTLVVVASLYLYILHDTLISFLSYHQPYTPSRRPIPISTHPAVRFLTTAREKKWTEACHPWVSGFVSGSSNLPLGEPIGCSGRWKMTAVREIYFSFLESINQASEVKTKQGNIRSTESLRLLE